MVLAGIGLYLAIYQAATLVSLLLLGYAGMVQFFPGIVLGLFWERVTETSVFTGMISGVAIAVILAIFKMDPIAGFNAGFVGLCVNFLLTFSRSAIAPATARKAALSTWAEN